MSELVDRIAANVGLDRAVAEKAIGIILDFLSKEGPADKVSVLIARLPGSEALLAAARGGDNGGVFGGMGGILGVGTRLRGPGPDKGRTHTIQLKPSAVSREHNAGDVLGEIAEAIPGLGQFI